MALNDTLLTIVRVLQIILLLVFIYGAVEGVMFIKETREIITEQLRSGEFMDRLIAAQLTPEGGDAQLDPDAVRAYIEQMGGQIQDYANKK